MRWRQGVTISGAVAICREGLPASASSPLPMPSEWPSASAGALLVVVQRVCPHPAWQLWGRSEPHRASL